MGRRFFSISCRVESDNDGNWRLDKLHKSILSDARRLTGTDKRVDDLYALYWLRRNEAVFQSDLHICERMMFLDYAKLVKEPKICIDKIIRHVGGAGAWKYFTTDAHQSSLNKNINVSISPEISVLCERLFDRLSKLGIRDFS